MMPDLDQFITFSIAATLLAATPGPDLIYVITRSALHGATAGLVAIAGISTGILGHTLLCILGLSAVLAASPTLFSIVKFTGALFLVYLGVKMFRADNPPPAKIVQRAHSLWSIYKDALVMNLLNPKVALFFLAFLPQFINPSLSPPAYQLAFLGLAFMIIAFTIMCLAGLTGAAAGGFAKSLRARAPWPQRFAGTMIVCLGGWLILEDRI